MNYKRHSMTQVMRMLLVIGMIYCSFSSCQNNNDNETGQPTTDKLLQTAWKGTLHCDGWTHKDWIIGLQFTTKDNGGVSYYPTDISPEDSQKKDNFTFVLNNKLITFQNSGILEGGPWTIVSYSSKDMILKQNISSADPNNVVTIEVHKISGN